MEQGAEAVQVVGVGEVAERNLQPARTEGLGPVEGGGQLCIGLRAAGHPQLQGRGKHALQALFRGGLGQFIGVFAGEQFFAPFNARGAGSGQHLDETQLAALANQVGAVAGEADGNGISVHCY